ncbi:hypothetical protein Hanom_Chr15g01413801 [Helianthus anomalus]
MLTSKLPITNANISNHITLFFFRISCSRVNSSACRLLMFLKRPGMILVDRKHIGGSTQPMKGQLLGYIKIMGTKHD